MRTIRVDDVDVPADERTFYSEIQALGPEYNYEISLREEAWIPHVAEHIRVYIIDHRAAVGTVSGYLLKSIVDLFKQWAIDRLKRAPGNTENLLIYGPDGKVARKVVVKTDLIKEE